MAKDLYCFVNGHCSLFLSTFSFCSKDCKCLLLTVLLLLGTSTDHPHFGIYENISYLFPTLRYVSIYVLTLILCFKTHLSWMSSYCYETLHCSILQQVLAWTLSYVYGCKFRILLSSVASVDFLLCSRLGLIFSFVSTSLCFILICLVMWALHGTMLLFKACIQLIASSDGWVPDTDSICINYVL